MTKVPEATKETLERGKNHFYVKIIVYDLKILKDMLNLDKTLWVEVKFCVVNTEIAHSMQRMLPKHVIAAEIGSTTAGLARLLGATANIPLGFLMINFKQNAECTNDV